MELISAALTKAWKWTLKRVSEGNSEGGDVSLSPKTGRRTDLPASRVGGAFMIRIDEDEKICDIEVLI